MGKKSLRRRTRGDSNAGEDAIGVPTIVRATHVDAATAASAQQFHANAQNLDYNDDDKEQKAAKALKSSSYNWKSFGWATYFLIASHLIALGVAILGLMHQRDFHTGVECSMTWSVPHYVPIHVAPMEYYNPVPYKLYKFVDRRDPRHKRLLDKTKPIPNGYCTPKSHVVVYVPGHWGSYDQCRSLGAHGIGLIGRNENSDRVSGVGRALESGDWNGEAVYFDRFVYDVYCVDFAGQGGALHGQLLKVQTSYVKSVVLQLAKECQVSQVTLVGHSVGGLVAQGVPAFYEKAEPLVKNVITLATPHIGLPYTFDKSIDEYYRNVNALEAEYLKDLAVISISGGMRDEFIHPASTWVGGTSSRHEGGLSVHSAMITKANQEGRLPTYGMDHKAIVWCEEVLYEVQRIIFHLALSTRAGFGRFDRLVSIHDQVFSENWKNVQFAYRKYGNEFHEELMLQSEEMLVDYGWLGTISLETVMYYNLECFFGIYALVCGLHYMFPARVTENQGILIFLLGVVAVLAGVASRNPVTSTATYTCLAHAIFYMIQKGSNLLNHRYPRGLFGRHWILVIVICTAVLHGCGLWWLVFAKQLDPIKPSVALVGFFVEFSILVELLAVAILTSGRNANDKDMILAALVLIVWPVLVAGKLTIIKWSFVQNLDLVDDRWVQFMVFIGVPLASRLWLAPSLAKSTPMEQDPKIDFFFNSLRGFAVMGSSYPLLHEGKGFLIGYMLSALSILDLAKHFLLRLKLSK